jgi:hypothetical protein
MNTFPKDVAKCAAKIAKVPSCDTTICDDAPDWVDGIFPLALSPTGHQSLPFSVAAPGEGVASLTIATVGTDWSTAGSESVVVTYDVDGTARGQLVLFGGETPTDTASSSVAYGRRARDPVCTAGEVSQRQGSVRDHCRERQAIPAGDSR